LAFKQANLIAICSRRFSRETDVMTISKQKTGLWIAALLLLALGGWGLRSSFSSSSSQGDAKQAVAIVTRGAITDIVTAQGKLEPKDYVDVGAQVSGQLKRLYVDIGAVVKTGELLADIDPQIYQSIKTGDAAKLSSLQAQLELQKAQTAFDQSQFDRAEKLVKTGAMSQGDFEDKDKAL
jgi:membrane fusion protein, macrolide-specific efflux system